MTTRYQKPTYDELKSQLKRAQVKIEELQQTQRKSSQKIKENRHFFLTELLNNLRSLIQLVATEKNPEKLIKHSCEKLQSPDTYLMVWMIVLDENKNPQCFESSGIDDKSKLELSTQIESRNYPACIEKSLKQPNSVYLHDPNEDCRTCPLKDIYHDHIGLSKPIIAENNVLGLVSVALPPETHSLEKEIEFFEELTQDLSTVFQKYRIEEQNKLQALILDHIRDQVTLTDLKGHILYINMADSLGLKRKPEELIGKHVEIYGDNPEKGATQKEIIENTLKHGEWRCEVVNYDKDGTELILDSHTWVIYDRKGNPKYLCGTSRDISALKEAELQRSKMEKKLLQTHKLEAIGKLAGGIAHEFNNILTYVQGNAQLLQEIISHDPEARVCVSEILNGTKNAAYLTHQLLAFSKRQVIEPAIININEVIEHTMTIISKTLGDHIQVKFKKHDEPIYIHADQGQMEHTLMNLCVNSRDAMPEGGKITIETSKIIVDDENIDKTTKNPSKKYFCLSVIDTGIGMEKEIMDRAFEPFFSTKHRHQASGLGLSMVYGMVQQHNGFMRLNSRQKHGTTVEIYIPLSKESPETSAKMSSVSDSKNTETILVAEDDTAVMKLIKRILERSGFHVITASDGEKAIEYGTQNIEKIDLVLLDVMMPEKSGLEVAQELSKLKPDLRILYSSGYNEFSQHTELAIPNDAEMIQKPYHREALIQKIRSILDNS